MRTIRRSVFVVAASLVVCGLAAAAEPVLLKYHQKEGDKAVYALSATVKSKLTTSEKPKPGRKPETATESVQMQCGIEFTKAIGLGRMQVTGRVLSGTAKASSGGHSETEPAGPYEERYVMTALGDIKSSEIVTGEPMVLPFSLTEFGPLDALVPGELPNAAVKSGDTWTAAENGPGADSGPAKMASTSKLLGEVTYAGRQCVKIKTTFHGTMQEDAPVSGLANRVPVKASLAGTIVWLFDPEAGIAVKSDVTGTQTTTARIEGVVAMSVTSNIEQHTRLTEWNGEAVEAN